MHILHLSDSDDVSLTFLAQLLQRGMDTGFDGSQRNLQDGGNLLLRILLQIMQDNDLLQLERQPVYGLQQLTVG
ncbi:hypothetical protein D3C72_1872230 [compost metagenome]